MKAKVYLRVARHAHGRARRYKVEASPRPSHEPVRDSKQQALPTVAFAIELDLPDHLFDRAQAVIAEINITGSQAKIAAKVATP